VIGCTFCTRRAKRRCPVCAHDLCANHSKMLSTLNPQQKSGQHRCAGCATVSDIREWLPLAESTTTP
jgi:hypothetical protein